jgi:predicted lipoprotein with Yx(FWY)xxD motif
MLRRFPLLAFAAVAAIALFAAACGGSSGSGGLYGSSKPASSAAAPATAAAKVAVGSSGLGTIVVNSAGRTLYLFEKDSSRKSMCDGACAAYWPPLISSGKPIAVEGAKTSLIGTIRRSDGSVQVTYAGHPLYLYAGDQGPGQTSGQGLTDFGAGWDALRPTGDKIESDQS